MTNATATYFDAEWNNSVVALAIDMADLGAKWAAEDQAVMDDVNRGMAILEARWQMDAELAKAAAKAA